MAAKRWALLIVCGVLMAPTAPGQAPPARPGLTPGSVLAALGGGSVDALAGTLRGFLVKAMPAPLFEDTRSWGTQVVVRQTHWRGKGLHVHPETKLVPKNDGQWWKVCVTTPGLADSLIVDLRDVLQPEPGRMTFTAYVAFDAHVDYDRQRWRSGVRTYAGSVRARMRIKLTLRCEATARLEGEGLLPSAVFRLRVLQANVGYDRFTVEHIPGIGGEAAKILGDAVHSSMQKWRPSLERNLIERASAAIVKAGDTQEVRVSLTKLFRK